MIQSPRWCQRQHVRVLVLCPLSAPNLPSYHQQVVVLQSQHSLPLKQGNGVTLLSMFLPNQKRASVPTGALAHFSTCAAMSSLTIDRFTSTLTREHWGCQCWSSVSSHTCSSSWSPSLFASSTLEIIDCWQYNSSNESLGISSLSQEGWLLVGFCVVRGFYPCSLYCNNTPHGKFYKMITGCWKKIAHQSGENFYFADQMCVVCFLFRHPKCLTVASDCFEFVKDVAVAVAPVLTAALALLSFGFFLNRFWLLLGLWLRLHLLWLCNSWSRSCRICEGNHRCCSIFM